MSVIAFLQEIKSARDACCDVNERRQFLPLGRIAVIPRRRPEPSQTLSLRWQYSKTGRESAQPQKRFNDLRWNCTKIVGGENQLWIIVWRESPWGPIFGKSHPPEMLDSPILISRAPMRLSRRTAAESRVSTTPTRRTTTEQNDVHHTIKIPECVPQHQHANKAADESRKKLTAARSLV